MEEMAMSVELVFGVGILVTIVISLMQCVKHLQPYTYLSTVFRRKENGNKSALHDNQNLKSLSKNHGHAKSEESHNKRKSGSKLKKSPTEINRTNVNFVSVYVDNGPTSPLANNVPTGQSCDHINDSSEIDINSAIYEIPQIYNGSTQRGSNATIYEPILLTDAMSGYNETQENASPDVLHNSPLFNHDQSSYKYPDSTAKPLYTSIQDDTNKTYEEINSNVHRINEVNLKDSPPPPPSLDTLRAISRQASHASFVSTETNSSGHLLSTEIHKEDL